MDFSSMYGNACSIFKKQYTLQIKEIKDYELILESVELPSFSERLAERYFDKELPKITW